MSISRIKRDFERIAESCSNSAKYLLCMCSCRYLELELTSNEISREDLSEEKRVIFDNNKRCCDDPTNAQIGFRYIEVCEVESDISDFEYSN